MLWDETKREAKGILSLWINFMSDLWIAGRFHQNVSNSKSEQGSRWHLMPRNLLQSPIYSPIPNISTFTRWMHCWPPTPHNQPPLLHSKDPQRALISAHGSLITHASAGSTVWLCSSTGGGGGTVCTPKTPSISLPSPITSLTHTQDLEVFSTTHLRWESVCVCVFCLGRGFSFLDSI